MREHLTPWVWGVYRVLVSRFIAHVMLSGPVSSLDSHPPSLSVRQDICDAVTRVLSYPKDRRRQLGASARQAFLRDRAALVEAMVDVRQVLTQRLGRQHQAARNG
jgi:hypothetical protein